MTQIPLMTGAGRTLTLWGLPAGSRPARRRASIELADNIRNACSRQDGRARFWYVAIDESQDRRACAGGSNCIVTVKESRGELVLVGSVQVSRPVAQVIVDPTGRHAIATSASDTTVCEFTIGAGGELSSRANMSSEELDSPRDGVNVRAVPRSAGHPLAWTRGRNARLRGHDPGERPRNERHQ